MNGNNPVPRIGPRGQRTEEMVLGLVSASGRRERGHEPKVRNKPSGSVPASAIVYVLVPNPKRPGTRAHARFACYQNGKTVKECLTAGVTEADIKYDVAHDFIVLDKDE